MTNPNASASPASTRATTSASGGTPLTSIGPAGTLGRHVAKRSVQRATAGTPHGMLRTATGSVVPQELLHRGEIAGCPQPFAPDTADERLERGLGAPPIPHVARDTGETQQDPPRCAVAAGEQVVERGLRALHKCGRR